MRLARLSTALLSRPERCIPTRPQTVALGAARSLRQPPHVFLGAEPRYDDYRELSLAPALIGGPVASAAAVHQLAITVGGFVTHGETIMLIVPRTDALVVEAKVAPQDIDHVHAGQQAFVRLTAFNEVSGTVTRVAADRTKEQQKPTWRSAASRH